MLVTLVTFEEAVAAADFKLVAASFKSVKLTQLPRRPPKFLGASKSFSLGAESLFTVKENVFSFYRNTEFVSSTYRIHTGFGSNVLHVHIELSR